MIVQPSANSIANILRKCFVNFVTAFTNAAKIAYNKPFVW